MREQAKNKADGKFSFKAVHDVIHFFDYKPDVDAKKWTEKDLPWVKTIFEIFIKF